MSTLMHPPLMRVKGLAIAFLLTLAAAQGCAAPEDEVSPAALVTMQGQLELRGNAPFTYPALVTPEKQWALKGLAADQIDQLQGKSISVTGVASNEPPVPAQLPWFLVKSVTPLTSP